jgi:hypothetical protein
MNRGDTVAFDFVINDENTDSGIYVLKDDDVLYFGLMDPHQPFEYALVKKRYTKDDCNEDGIITITIDPSDTLDLYPGVYYYAIKLHRMTDNELEHIDEVLTIINKTKFIICD